MSSQSARASLGLTLLGYMVLATLAITFTPFDLAIPRQIAFSGYSGPFDLVANVALFLPIGFLHALGSRRTGGAAALRALVFGALLSALIETCQIFIRGRCPSFLDLAANAAGAFAGARAYLGITQAWTARLAERFALELPLMGLFYLLVPLLWLNGLTATSDPSRLTMSAILGVIGAFVLASVWHHRLAPAGILSRGSLAFAATGWFALASLPGLFASPIVACASVAAVGITARVFASPLAAALLFRVEDRRFEVPTIQRAFPLFAAYLAAQALWPAHAPRVPLTGVAGELAHLRVVEWIAAYSLAGFMLAELRGRLDEARARWAAMIALRAGAFAAAIELAHALRDGHAMPARPLLATIAAIAGGAIYRLQVGAIQEIVAEGRPVVRRSLRPSRPAEIVSENCAPVQVPG